MALSFSIDSPYGMDIFNNIMDIFFVIDLLLNFKLAYYHKYVIILMQWEVGISLQINRPKLC